MTFGCTTRTIKLVEGQQQLARESYLDVLALLNGFDDAAAVRRQLLHLVECRDCVHIDACTNGQVGR